MANEPSIVPRSSKWRSEYWKKTNQPLRLCSLRALVLSPLSVLTPPLDHTPTVACLSPPATDILSANSRHCCPRPPITLCQRYLKGAVKILVLTPCRLSYLTVQTHQKQAAQRQRGRFVTGGVIPVRVAQGWCSLQKDKCRNTKGWQEHWLKKTMSKKRVKRKMVEKG